MAEGAAGYIVYGVAAGLGLIGSEAERQDVKKRVKKQEKAQAVVTSTERAIQSEQAARQRRKQVQQAQRAQAQIANVAAAGGQSQSSAPMVGAGGVAAQAGSNVAALNQQITGQNQLTLAQSNLFRTQAKPPSTKGQVAGQVGRMGMNLTGQFVETSAQKLFE